MKQVKYAANGRTYLRVGKPTAKAVYESGQTVILCPCNLRPFSIWNPQVPVQNKSDDRSFEAVVNAFVYYNCINQETGRRPYYFIEDGVAQ